MKSIIVKLFLVLCCQTAENGQFKYEVRSLTDSEQVGSIYSNTRYFEGDTIKIKFQLTLNK